MSKIPPTAVIENPAGGGGEEDKKGVRFLDRISDL